MAALGDLHCREQSTGAFEPLFARICADSDVLLLCGDLTDRGTEAEARVLAREIALGCRVPVIAVLGNHDHEADAGDGVRRALVEAGVRVLDGEACEVGGVGFAGTKGFAGGFGNRVLEPWGEDSLKCMVRETMGEALKLEGALAKLHAVERRVAVLHYAPIRETVEGEPLEIYPFLGCSRLAPPLDAFRVAACFHGHAHYGTPKGKTGQGTAVYNCAYPLLLRTSPERPWHVVEV
ncbi:metallophosphoesterase [Myxococcota bacterium]|nr:metallophosphoesterase [Myxococcota bacterium]